MFARTPRKTLSGFFKDPDPPVTVTPSPPKEEALRRTSSGSRPASGSFRPLSALGSSPLPTTEADAAWTGQLPHSEHDASRGHGGQPAREPVGRAVLDRNTLMALFGPPPVSSDVAPMAPPPSSSELARAQAKDPILVPRRRSGGHTPPKPHPGRDRRHSRPTTDHDEAVYTVHHVPADFRAAASSSAANSLPALHTLFPTLTTRLLKPQPPSHAEPPAASPDDLGSELRTLAEALLSTTKLIEEGRRALAERRAALAKSRAELSNRALVAAELLRVLLLTYESERGGAGERDSGDGGSGAARSLKKVDDVVNDFMSAVVGRPPTPPVPAVPASKSRRSPRGRAQDNRFEAHAPQTAPASPAGAESAAVGATVVLASPSVRVRSVPGTQRLPSPREGSAEPARPLSRGRGRYAGISAKVDHGQHRARSLEPASTRSKVSASSTSTGFGTKSRADLGSPGFGRIQAPPASVDSSVHASSSPRVHFRDAPQRRAVRPPAPTIRHRGAQAGAVTTEAGYATAPAARSANVPPPPPGMAPPPMAVYSASPAPLAIPPPVPPPGILPPPMPTSTSASEGASTGSLLSSSLSTLIASSIGWRAGWPGDALRNASDDVRPGGYVQAAQARAQADAAHLEPHHRLPAADFMPITPMQRGF